MIYKLCPREHWDACQRDGVLPRAEVDRNDGFIHLSAAHQLRGTADKHFRGRSGLMLLEVDPAKLPADALRWEVSRGGDRFPHLYGDLPRLAVVRAESAQAGDDGLVTLPFGESDGELDSP